MVGIFGPKMGPSLTFKYPRTIMAYNNDLFINIKKIKQTAAHHRLAYLTAGQVADLNRVFVLHNSVCDHQLNHSSYDHF